MDGTIICSDRNRGKGHDRSDLQPKRYDVQGVGGRRFEIGGGKTGAAVLFQLRAADPICPGRSIGTGGGFPHPNHGVFRNGEPFMAAQELLYSAHRIYDWECGSAESDGFHLGGRRKAADRGGCAAKVSGRTCKD